MKNGEDSNHIKCNGVKNIRKITHQIYIFLTTKKIEYIKEKFQTQKVLRTSIK